MPTIIYVCLCVQPVRVSVNYWKEMNAGEFGSEKFPCFIKPADEHFDYDLYGLPADEYPNCVKVNILYIITTLSVCVCNVHLSLKFMIQRSRGKNRHWPRESVCFICCSLTVVVMKSFPAVIYVWLHPKLDYLHRNFKNMNNCGLKTFMYYDIHLHMYFWA